MSESPLHALRPTERVLGGICLSVGQKTICDFDVLYFLYQRDYD